jgi:hypothetical protein
MTWTLLRLRSSHMGPWEVITEVNSDIANNSVKVDKSNNIFSRGTE